MYIMYLNNNDLMDEERAIRMSSLIPDYETMLCIRRLGSDDIARVKQAFAELCEEHLDDVE